MSDYISAKYGSFMRAADPQRYTYSGLWSLPNTTEILSHRGGTFTVDVSAEMLEQMGAEATERVCREYGYKEACRRFPERR